MDASLSHLPCYNKDNTQLQISQIGISKISISGKPPWIIQQSWNKTCQLFFFFFPATFYWLHIFSFDEPGGLGPGRSVPMENVGAGKALKPFISQFPLSESKAGRIKTFNLSLLLLILCFGCNYLVWGSSSSLIPEIWASKLLHQDQQKPVGGRTNPGLLLPGHHGHSQNTKLGVSVPIPVPQPQTGVK